MVSPHHCDICTALAKRLRQKRQHRVSPPSQRRVSPFCSSCFKPSATLARPDFAFDALAHDSDKNSLHGITHRFSHLTQKLLDSQNCQRSSRRFRDEILDVLPHLSRLRTANAAAFRKQLDSRLDSRSGPRIRLTTVETVGRWSEASDGYCFKFFLANTTTVDDRVACWAGLDCSFTALWAKRLALLGFRARGVICHVTIQAHLRRLMCVVHYISSRQYSSRRVWMRAGNGNAAY